MAITISERPRQIVYYNNDSPAQPVYSNWNAGWNPIVYKFSVANEDDINSTLVVRIYELGTDTFLSEDNIRPFRTGELIFDCGDKVRNYLLSSYSPSFINYDNSADPGNSIQFYITYTQILPNASQVFSSEQQRPIKAVCSAMRTGDKDNGNLKRFVPFNTDLPEQNKMKFLSCFETPVMWAGWPFSLSFIFSENIAGYELIKVEDELNINGQLLASNDTLLDASQIGRVNYLRVNDPQESDTDYIVVSLESGTSLPNYYVDPGYVEEGYVQVQ